MAIDTRDKRFSIPRMGGLRRVRFPLADGGLDNAADRRQLLGFYRGITIGEVPSPYDWVDIEIRGIVLADRSFEDGDYVIIRGKYRAT